MKQPRERHVRERFADRMNRDVPQFRRSLFGGGFEEYDCYRWQDGNLNYYVTLRIDPVDDKFDVLVTWMLTGKPPFLATPGAPSGEPNENGLSVDLSLFLGHHATPWKVKYTPDPDKLAGWMTRHPDAREVAFDLDKLKAFYYVDEAVDAVLDRAIPYFAAVKAKYGRQ